MGGAWGARNFTLHSMQDWEQRIAERLAELPARPGVYLMKNGDGKVIYVGKAKLLNRRVRSYFDGREKNGHRAATLMLPHIRDIEWILTETEAEALILEANLIRKYFPVYNVRQKDDKHYPYLMVSMNEAFPRVRVVRQVRDDGNLYFGPYLSSRAMRTLLDIIPRFFKLRECDLKLPLKTPCRPCLAWHIGRCDAPCAEKTTVADYNAQVKSAVRLLEGRRDDLLKQWEDEMREAARVLDFEKAARLRDQVQAVQATFVKHKADVSDATLSLDVVAVCRSEKLATVVILEYRNGVFSERRHFHLECNLGQDEAEILAEFLPGWYLQQTDVPPEVALEHGLDEETDVVCEALSRQAGRKVAITVPQRGEKLGFLRLARANAEMLLVELKAQSVKYDEIDRSVFDLQKELDLPKPPFRIECFDISHLAGTQPVASMVSFRNGRSERSQYRRFRVKEAQGGDDFGSMREIVGRRLTRLLDEGKPLPDLLVIDGGKGQVDAAWAVLNSLGLAELPVIGLAKRLEEIVLPGPAESVLLRRTSAGLKLLQRARDEAHRFAIQYQRSRRVENLKVQWLDVPGVGETLRAKILTKYRSRADFLDAPPEDLEALLGAKRATMVREAVLAGDVK